MENFEESSIISFHSEEIEFSLTNEGQTESWVRQCIDNQRLNVGEITYVFCSDEYLLEMNKTHLEHDYYTDIITFDYREEDIVSGDLFISIDRIKDNAENLKSSFDEELHRVMIHGVLHIMGYGDKTEKEKIEMRRMEDYCLTLRQ